MTYLVGVAGGSGSGKSTITDLVKQHLEAWGLTSHILTTDDCYNDLSSLSDDARRNLRFNPKLNYDHPDSIDFNLLLDLAGKLKRGEDFSYRKYDFNTNRHDDEDVVNVDARLDVGFVEGNYALFSGNTIGSSLIDLYDHKLFVVTRKEYAAVRRTIRDIRHRGRTPQDVARQLMTTVFPMYTRHIEPTRENADDIVDWHVPMHLPEEVIRQSLIDLAYQRALFIFAEATKRHDVMPSKLRIDEVDLKLPVFT